MADRREHGCMGGPALGEGRRGRNCRSCHPRCSPHKAAASPRAVCWRGGLPIISRCPDSCSSITGWLLPQDSCDFKSGSSLGQPLKYANDWRQSAALSVASIPYPRQGTQRMRSVGTAECMAWVPDPGYLKEEVWWELPPLTSQPASPGMPGRVAVTLTSERPPSGCRVVHGGTISRAPGGW